MAVSEQLLSEKIEKTSIQDQLKEQIKEKGWIDENFSLKNDLEKLLKLAEELKENCDKAKSSIRTYRFMQFGEGILFLALTFLIIIYFSYSSLFVNLLIAFAGLSLLVIGALLYQSRITEDNKRFLADTLALSEVLQLLRETSNIIAEQEEWSLLSRAEFRIRLSRFNLEEKSKSAFNFFS